LTDRIDKEFIDKNLQLKIIANYAVGFDNIDTKYANQKGIIVTNTPDVLTPAVADITFGLLVVVARRIIEADSFTRKGKYKGWQPDLFLGQEIYGKTLGIIGLGRIGTAVAERAKGFSMKILYNTRTRDKQIEERLNAKYTSINSLLKESDFISLHVPLTPETKHLISKEQLNMMKKTAILVNTSRGPIVDEKALVQALKQKKIAGAALDVYEFEPKLSSDLKNLKNIVLTPHIASASVEARSAMGELATKNIIAVLQGKRPLTPVR
jgi:glyoxylate reductase